MPKLVNNGRQILQIAGLSGVASPGNALWNAPVNARYHRMTLNTADTNGAADPATMLTALRLIVNGVTMWDIAPDSIKRICIACGYTPATGELPLWFTDPSRNVNLPNEATSWDMFGQSTFTLQAAIAAAVTAPALSGTYEFDGMRNTKVSADGKSQVPFLQPVARHQFGFNLAIGTTAITNLPIDYPISRIWLNSVGSKITKVEVIQDGNKVLEGTPAEINQNYSQYGFVFGATSFETAFIADPDQRWSKALNVANSLNLKVTLSAAAVVTAVVETLPGAYQS